MEEIPGIEDKTSVRLCPLGLTAIGIIDDEAEQSRPSTTRYPSERLINPSLVV